MRESCSRPWVWVGWTGVWEAWRRRAGSGVGWGRAGVWAWVWSWVWAWVGWPGLWVDRLSLVGHVRHEARVAADVVGDPLDATVGQRHHVATASLRPRALFLVAEGSAAVAALHCVAEVVLGGLLGTRGNQVKREEEGDGV